MSLIEKYNNLLINQGLNNDDEQYALVERLNIFTNKVTKKNGKFSKIINKLASQNSATDGFYIFGPVGTGKSMIMSLFFDYVPVKLKKRMHFHNFVQYIHEELQKLRKNHTRLDNSLLLMQIARDLANKFHVLCLDELEIKDVVNASIFGKLIEMLSLRGVFVVITSNSAPDDLYKDGLQRQTFIPAINFVKKHFEIHKLDNFIDYRKQKLKSMTDFFIVQKNADHFADVIEMIIPRPKFNQRIVEVMGRAIKFNNVVGNIAIVSFAELCAEALGPADFSMIAQQYDMIIMHSLPKLHAEERNEARRFINLLDEIYENKVMLITISKHKLNEIFQKDLNLPETERAISRLHEIQSVDYLKGSKAVQYIATF